jgi:FtsH-binding integral membrane protein
MNIKAMRNIHLYLGVFFAPLLAFFLISGSWQTFDLHEASKSGNYVPPAIIKSLSQVHKDQRWVDSKKIPESSMPFKCLILLMATGLLATTLLGIIMAFKYTKRWIVWGCLLMGVLVPCFLIWIAHR